MSDLKLKYNPETLSFDLIRRGLKYYLSRIFSVTGLGAIIGVVFFFVYMNAFDSPKETGLARENSRLVAQYEILSQKLDQVQVVLDDIQLRDENVYRVIYQADSIPNSIRKAGFGGVNRYSYLEDMSNADLVINTSKKLDVITKQLYVQSTSFDEIISLARRNEEMIRSVPSIQPISNKDLIRTASGFGQRIDPIYKTPRQHNGMDFTAPTGTDVYVTGDGIVEKVVIAYHGFGKHIVINHGFGFHTLYAHLSAFNVKEGQKVKRGDVIGAVGNTGKSTASHLHYEVHVKGRPVNPANYYFQDLDEEQYEKMIHISSNSNQTFD